MISANIKIPSAATVRGMLISSGIVVNKKLDYNHGKPERQDYP